MSEFEKAYNNFAGMTQELNWHAGNLEYGRAMWNAALEAAAKRAEIVRDEDIPTAIRALKEQSNG